MDTLLTQILKEIELRQTDIAGVGATLSGPSSPRTGNAADPTHSISREADIRANLQKHLGLPFIVGRPTNLSALAHSRRHASRNLIYLDIGPTVIAGLVLNGELHTWLLEPFRRGLLDHAVNGIGSFTDITVNALGGDVAAIGGAALAAQEYAQRPR